MFEFFEDLIFYGQQYLDAYSFFIPLGFIGVWRWTIWGIKKFGASFYRPNKTPYKGRVSIITPVYNEDPEIFFRALNSWKRNNPSEIIAVIDYSDKKCIEIFNVFSKKFKEAKLIITKEPGKRPALALGIKKAKEEIVALVDSDTIWENEVITKTLPPFNDYKVAGVGTYQNVLNPKTFSQRIFDTQLDLRYSDDFPFMSAAGDALVCLSGRTAFYRRKVILPMLPDLVNETFLGEKVISGDDKRLTYLVLQNGWKVAYQSNAKVYTPGMSDFNSFLKQRLRWTRNSIRADLRAMKQGWTWKHPGLAFFQIDKIFQSFAVVLSPIFFLVSILTGLYLGAGAIFIWWFLSRAIKMYPHLKRKPKDTFILPLFILYSMLTAVLKVYAFFSLNTQGWITRWDKQRLPRIKFARYAFASLSTFAFIGLLFFAVYIYKDLTFFRSLELRNQAAAKVLEESSDLKIVAIKSRGIKEDLVSEKYEVKNGDSLGSIAQKFGIEVSNLREANVSRLINWNSVEPGLILTIPGKDVKLTSLNRFNYQRIYGDSLLITFDESSNTIFVLGRAQKITLKDIRDSVGKEHLEEVEPKIWYLKSNLFLRSGVTLTLNKDEVKWLKMASNKKNFVNLQAFNGTIFIDGVKITSWDEEKNEVDKEMSDGRSFILVKDGTRMDIYNSDLSYLGFPTSPDLKVSPYGVSWRMSNGRLGTTLLTGEVMESKFHHNYFGAYTFGATGMRWIGNEFYENVRYGLDPHDDSNGFLVEKNIFHHNGSHGLIFSKRCLNNIIRNNISYGNKLHGIMLHESSNNNLIENNKIYENTDGIALWNSSDNIVRNNEIINNKKNGVRANRISNGNVIANNIITKNLTSGIYLYDFSEGNLIKGNEIQKSNNAIYVKSNNNQLADNFIKRNKIGIYLLENASNNKLKGNVIVNNRYYGVYSKIPKVNKNFVSSNSIEKNGKNIFARY